MKPITKTLLSCIKKFTPITQKVSGPARERIMSLFHKIRAAKKQWNLHKSEILRTKHESSEIYKHDSYNYIPVEIREKIEKDCLPYIHYSYSFTLSRVFNLYFMCSFEITHAHVVQKIERIYQWFVIACAQNPNLQCSKTINIYLYCVDFPKTLPKSDFQKIDMIHANTAFTTGCQNTTNIVLYREEEWFKVLMHESFHNLGLDFIELPPADLEIIENELRQRFKIEKVKDIRFYETYCEIWAEIMNILFIVTRSSSHSTRRKTKRNVLGEKLWKEFKQKMMYESLFSCFQCAKIMSHNKMHYIDFINPGEISPKISKEIYQENTYVFSYYVLKSILMFDYPAFLDFAVQSDTMKFQLTLEHARKYVELISRNYQNPIYLKTIADMENSISECKDTLRMTLFEI